MPYKSAVDVDPVTANGNYYRSWSGGRGIFRITGTWDTATATLSVLQPDGSTYLAVGTDTTLTADGAGQFFLAAGSRIAMVLSSVGGSTSLQYLIESAGD